MKLSSEETRELRQEKESVLSQRGMRIVIITVSLAAFLQGFVQSSFNGANLYERYWRNFSETDGKENQAGLVNAIPYLSAALLGCPLSDPINHLIGRKWTIFMAAGLIFISSIASAFLPFDNNGLGRSNGWELLCGLRVINGFGGGLKAVSTPILASETAVGYWRGSSILAWQLW